MLSNIYLLPLTLPLRPSHRITLGLFIGHASSLALLPVIALPLRYTLSLAVFIGLQLYFLWRSYQFLGGDAVTELELLSSGEWHVTTLQHPKCSARLLNDSVVHPQLTILSFQLTDKRRRNAVLTVDNVDAELFRRLRVRLRFLPLTIQANGYR